MQVEVFTEEVKCKNCGSDSKSIAVNRDYHIPQVESISEGHQHVIVTFWCSKCNFTTEAEYILVRTL